MRYFRSYSQPVYIIFLVTCYFTGFIKRVKSFRTKGIEHVNTKVIKEYDMDTHIVLLISYEGLSGKQTLVDRGT